MGGPLLFIPLSSIIGRSSLIFWSLFGSLASNVWAPLMTGPNDYIPFVMSRMMAGLFGSVPPILAAGLIMDLYFLHQRGKAFTVLEVCLLAGAVAAPVFGGFIADTKPWPDVFWWLVAIIAVSIPLGMGNRLLNNIAYSHWQHSFAWKRRASKRRGIGASPSAPDFVHVEPDRDLLSRNCRRTPDDIGPRSKSIEHMTVSGLIDRVGPTLHHTVQNWTLTSNHDSRFLRCVHLRICGRVRHSGLHLFANTGNGWRLRLHAKSECRMWVAFEEVSISAQLLTLRI